MNKRYAVVFCRDCIHQDHSLKRCKKLRFEFAKDTWHWGKDDFYCKDGERRKDG